ncbi:hypothetical protein ASZ90_009157 [hydrocarbon metagenome]|uniref:Uncharacterized protein n=1 Tax=hydrocarbon metagenome TaxID=938273 RepID=A0A0W8FJK3_9ZZZZ
MENRCARHGKGCLHRFSVVAFQRIAAAIASGRFRMAAGERLPAHPAGAGLCVAAPIPGRRCREKGMYDENGIFMQKSWTEGQNRDDSHRH